MRRPTAEVAQAHDVVWREIIDPATRAQLDLDTLRTHFVVARTLCWVLGHDVESPVVDAMLDSIVDLTVAVERSSGGK